MHHESTIGLADERSRHEAARYPSHQRSALLMLSVCWRHRLTAINNAGMESLIPKVITISSHYRH